ncbi:hypothetical protein QQ045_006883 [Rhodiola kirilowii]
MTPLKVIIVISVVIVGASEVDVVNWSPFIPNGFQPVLSIDRCYSSLLLCFAYVGFDAVANSAGESKKPQMAQTFFSAVTTVPWLRKEQFVAWLICKSTPYTTHPHPFPNLGRFGCYHFSRAIQHALALPHPLRWNFGLRRDTRIFLSTIIPGICILFNMFLFAQLHKKHGCDSLVLSVVSVGVYAAYASPILIGSPELGCELITFPINLRSSLAGSPELGCELITFPINLRVFEMSGRRSNRTSKDCKIDEVDELLKAKEDELLLNLSVGLTASRRRDEALDIKLLRSKALRFIAAFNCLQFEERKIIADRSDTLPNFVELGLIIYLG